jgi:hypothetical protein
LAPQLVQRTAHTTEPVTRLVCIDQVTRRRLPVERSAILTALINSIGESVRRRVGDPLGSIPTPEITTSDRFTDEWMPRIEIIEANEQSSGFDRALSEFALFLMESRVDLLLSAGTISIIGIGQIRANSSLQEMSPTTQEIFQRLDSALVHSAAVEPAGWTRVLRNLFRKGQEPPVSRLVEEAQLIATFRSLLPTTSTCRRIFQANRLPSILKA